MDEHTTLKPVEHQNQRILTTQQIAEAYEADPQIITNNFNRNKKRYTEGKHFFSLEGEALVNFQSTNQIDLSTESVNNKRLNKLYLWTEKGAWLLAKSLNTDKAWQACEMLVDTYYRQKEEIAALTDQLALTKERIDALIDPILDLTLGHGLGDVDYEIASILLHRLTRIASDLETITKKAPKNLKQQDVGKAISLLLDVKNYLSQLRHHVKVETAVHDLLLEIEIEESAQQIRALISEGKLIEGPGNTKEEEDDYLA